MAFLSRGRSWGTAASLACMLIAAAPTAQAQDFFIGQLSVFAGDYCPRGWAAASGQLLPVNQNQALFALLGTAYGGDGVTTFALPDLRGRQAIGVDIPDSTNRSPQGQETITLTTAHLPPHTHQLLANTAPATHAAPKPGYALATMQNGAIYTSSSTADQNIAIANTSAVGSSQPVSVQSPALAQTWCINLQGAFPSRN